MIGRRKGSSSLTALELQLMQVLWRDGPGTVLHVQTRLSSSKELAYTTVQTVLNTLERKGKVDRVLAGRAFTYKAAASKESVLTQAIRDLAERMFGGSSEDLVMSLVKSRQVDPTRIADLSRIVAAEETSILESKTVTPETSTGETPTAGTRTRSTRKSDIENIPPQGKRRQ